MKERKSGSERRTDCEKETDRRQTARARKSERKWSYRHQTLAWAQPQTWGQRGRGGAESRRSRPHRPAPLGRTKAINYTRLVGTDRGCLCPPGHLPHVASCQLVTAADGMREQCAPSPTHFCSPWGPHGPRGAPTQRLQQAGAGAPSGEVGRRGGARAGATDPTRHMLPLLGAAHALGGGGLRG